MLRYGTTARPFRFPAPAEQTDCVRNLRNTVAKIAKVPSY
jgi:hypothetical protein